MRNSTIQCTPRYARRAAGFTLLEMMITLTVAGILAAIALPGFREFSIRVNVTNNVNELVGALNTARSEAVKRGRQVAVIANNGTDWNGGWQIIAGKALSTGAIDPPATPGSTEPDCAGYMDLDGETPLCARFDGALPATYTILSKSTGGSSADTQVVFGATGMLVGGATSFDFSVCRPSTNADPAQSRRVHVEQSGIITTLRDTSSSPAGSCS